MQKFVTTERSIKFEIEKRKWDILDKTNKHTVGEIPKQLQLNLADF